MENLVNKKILYIEDDFFIGQMYGDFLNKSGYQVVIESDGDKGLMLARDNQFDLILLDIMLPGKNGDQILQALRGKEDLIPNTKVIIVTNYQQPDESRKALELQADAYLTKTDLTPSALLDIISQLLSNH